jgi:hypothetical protein
MQDEQFPNYKIGEKMFKNIIQRFDLLDEQGMTTAEYAVGTVAAAGFGSILLKILMSTGIEHLLAKAIQHAFRFLFG